MNPLSSPGMDSPALVPIERIERAILVIRGHKVMLDADLAKLYGVTTGNLNKTVKRNLRRFLEDFMFQLSREEAALLFQIGRAKSGGRGGRQTPPYAFTEHDVAILSYAVKYASAYYGPFREAADSAPQHGDRRAYQMDTRNAREAVREAQLDETEGADMLMVKPALAYLDVIRRVREVTTLPLAAYNVSGEYSAVKAAAERRWLDEAAVVRENLQAMARAGADIIITYHAREALAGGWL